MADGALIDYYSPSGSTIELIDLAGIRPSSRPSSRIPSASSLSWNPKLTLYRLLVILSTVSLAIAKTATSYLNLTFASITLEWILGVVIFLLWVLAILWLITTYVMLVFTFSAYMRRPAIDISRLRGMALIEHFTRWSKVHKNSLFKPRCSSNVHIYSFPWPPMISWTRFRQTSSD